MPGLSTRVRVITSHRLRGALAVVALAACHAGGTPAPASARPRLLSLIPETVSPERGTPSIIELRGRGFAATNRVQIGSVRIDDVPGSADGTVLRFLLPAGVPVPGGGAPPQPWPDGPHPVFVTTAGGTSDTLRLIVRAPGGPRP